MHLRQSLKRFSRPIIILILIGSGLRPAVASDPDLAARISEIVEKSFKPDRPGAAVVVVKDGKVIFRKGYGKANLELGVAIEPDMVFRIGSITKQFTATAILMLAEQGKLSITDEITKYLPDYPVQGHKITIEHLLTHTSGIKSYTSLPEWLTLWRKDMKLDELIALFKDKPMEFAPGEKWSYNNSGYVLLGAIIEKASGETYQDFIEKRIFAPLGMTHSFYDRTERIIPRRASGYSKRTDGYVNAAYLSMTQPYAAGSLASSVDDLALWDAALYTDKLVKQESLMRAWTPFKLNNGKPTNYGYGWAIGAYEGHRIIQHDGGINGFVTSGLRLPDDKLYVAVLTNQDTPDPSPGEIAFKIAALAIGKPYKDPVAIALPSNALDQYTGVYQVTGENEEIIIRRDGDKLFVSRGPGRAEILPISEIEFFLKPMPRDRLTFVKSAGAITGVVWRSTYGTDQHATKTSKPLPASSVQPAVKVDPAVYDNYAGEYELMPGFSLTITREGDKLMAQATGQPKVELHPESQTKFGLREVDAQVEFVVDGSGKATSLVLLQGGQKLTGKRTK